MTGSSRLRLLAICLLTASACARAADEPVFQEGAHEQLAGRVMQAQKEEYAKIVASLDARLAAHPDDVVAAVERCRFIDFFAFSEENYIESASEASEGCTEVLGNGVFADKAPARLYLFQRQWGDDAKQQGEALVPSSSQWPTGLQARLHERLATLYAPTDLIKAGPHAMQAIRLDPQSDSRLIAAEYLVRIGAKAAAVKTIEATPKAKWSPWQLGESVKLLVGMDDARKARDLVDANAGVSLLPDARVLLARALFTSGASDAAARMLKGASFSQDQYVSLATLREWFELERDYGSAERAEAAYRRLRDRGYDADPFGRHRLSLSVRHPGTAWHMDDLLGIGSFLLAIAVCALLPLLIVGPLHYRSIVKQLRGNLPAPPSPTAPWSLRHVWYALAVTLVGGMSTLYFMNYPTFHALIASAIDASGQYEVLSSEGQLANALLVTTSVSVLALLPLLRRVDLRSLFLGRWSVKRSLFIGVGASLAVLAINAIFRLLKGDLSGAAMLGTNTMRSVQGIHALYGAGAAFLFVAILVPVMEEFVFRGVMLRTMSRYVAIWAAVLIQGGAFVVWHEDYTSYPVIFTIAMLAAWLAHRSGGLLAPIMLHVTNNAIAMLSIVAMSRAFQYLRP